MLSKTLKMLRLNNRMTQQQVAKLLNVDRSTYTYYETGKIKPDLDTLIKLCCIFNTSIETLTKDYGNSLQALHQSVDDYLADGQNMQSFSGLNKQEQNAILLFRLSPDKEKALNLLKDLALSADSCRIPKRRAEEKEDVEEK